MRAAASRTLEGEALFETLAFLEQGEDFYDTAEGRLSAQPLLHYYAMLNVGKALLRLRNPTIKLEAAHHGLQDLSAGAVEPRQVQIKVKAASSNYPRVFGEVLSALGYGYPTPAEWRASDLMSQVVVGHRLWREATGGRERFIPLDDIDFIHNRSKKQIWLRLRIAKETLRRHGIAQKRVLKEGGLSPGFRRVTDGTDPARFLCFEQTKPVAYSHRPTENVMDLVNRVKPSLWRVMSALPERSYRRYYLHLTSKGDLRVSQLAAMWSLLFYFGSVVRYRPHRFTDILQGPYGPFVDEFISAQPKQMLYMLASEMSLHEVASPAIV